MKTISEIDILLKSKKGRILHQVWFGTIPNKRSAKKSYDKLSIYRKSWEKKNPDWYRMEWNLELSKAAYFNPEKSEFPSA